MMTRRNYKLLAAALQGAYDTSPCAGEWHLYRHICKMIAVELKRDNPRCDVERFLAACGTTP